MKRALVLLCLAAAACSPVEDSTVALRRDAYSGTVLGRGAAGEGLGAVGLDRCGSSTRFVANTETGRVWGSWLGVSPFDGPDGGASTIACLGASGMERIVAGGPAGLFKLEGATWVPLSAIPNRALASNAAANRLIALTGPEVEVRDGEGLFLASFAGMGANYIAVAWNPAGTHYAVLDAANLRVLLFDASSMGPSRSVQIPPGVPAGPTLAFGNFDPALGPEVALGNAVGTVHVVNVLTQQIVRVSSLGGKFGSSMTAGTFNGGIDALWVGDPMNNVVRQMVGTMAFSTVPSTDDEGFGSAVELGAAGAGRADGGAGAVYVTPQTLPTMEGIEATCIVGVSCPVCGDLTGLCIGGVLCTGLPLCGSDEVCTSAGCVVPGADGGVADAGALDGGVIDAGIADGGAIDAGAPADAGAPDAGVVDAGLDAGTGLDGGKGDSDAGVRDAGTKLDAGVDAGLADAGVLPTDFTASGCTCSTIEGWSLLLLALWATRRSSDASRQIR